MKKTDGWKIFIGGPKDFNEKEQVTKRCLEIANQARFPTDYQDMYEHLFENEDAELFMIMDEKEQIYGFATCDNNASSSNTYLHGIIIHPDVQGMGFSLRLLHEIIKKDGNKFFTARTHNPRIYEMMSKIAYDEKSIFPNRKLGEIPKDVWDVVWSHSAMKDADNDLIVRNAYPDEKIMQKVRNEKINDMFKKLNPTDAQVIVVYTKKPF